MLLKKVLFGAAIGLTLVATTALGSLDVPAGAQASDTLDLGGQAVLFDATNQTVEPAGLVGSPMDVGSTLTYRNAVTIGSTVVDAVITLVDVENVVDNQAFRADRANSNPYLEGRLDGSAANYQVRYRIAFYRGGTYTGVGTGDPVTLLGLRAHVYDVDGTQFVEMGGFTTYQLATNSILTVSPGSSGRTRFAEMSNIETSTGDGTSYTQGRVSVRYDAVSSFEFVFGSAIYVSNSNSSTYSLDLSADGQAFADSVGGGPAAQVANPTLGISAVGPASASTAGGQTVTIRGAGFVSGTTVQIGGAACTDVVVTSATELTCRVPAGSGTVDAVVTNPDSSTATLVAAFRYIVPVTTTTAAPTTTVPPTTAPPTTAAPTTVAPTTAAPAAAPAELAATGRATPGLAPAALASLVAGVALLGAVRRRRASVVSDSDQK